MQFFYIYKTSDGLRHKEEIGAPDRDSAFTALRERGIHPIKVFEKLPEQKPRKSRLAVVALAVWGMSIFLVLGWLATRHAQTSLHKDGSRYQEETREAILKLIEKADALEERHKAEMKLLNLDRLHDYVFISKTNDLSGLFHELEKAAGIISYTRLQTKELFKDVLTQFPAASANERADAQRRYGSLMQFVDASEERVQGDQYALMLLDERRGDWHVVDRKIVFKDSKLEQEYNYFSTPTDGSTARWKQDFGTVIESAPVEIPKK